MVKNGPYLSIVIPAYNEVGNFRAGVLHSVVEWLGKQKFSWEVVFVDDGSMDETHKLLARFCRENRGFKLMKIPHGGKAAAVTAGMLAGQGQLILFTDFDQSTPIYEVSKFIDHYRRGADVVIAVRNHTENDTWVRRWRSWAFVKLVQLVVLPGIKDSQCGFKSFTQAAARKVFSALEVCRPGHVRGGYMGAFDVEALFLARKAGLRIAQVPVEWIKVPSDKLNIWTESFKMVRDICKVRLYDILGRYG